MFNDRGQDPIIAMFSINLPIWRERLDAALREARHNHRAAIRDKTQKLNTLNAQLKLALYRFRDGQRKINAASSDGSDFYKLGTLLEFAAETGDTVLS